MNKYSKDYSKERETAHENLPDGFYFVIAVESPGHPFKTIAEKYGKRWRFSECALDESDKFPKSGPDVYEVVSFIMTSREYLEQPS